MLNYSHYYNFKGVVQCYGNYSQLTSSGLDHNELFNDIKDNSKLPEDADYQDSSMEAPRKMRRMSVSKRCLSSAPSTSSLLQSGGRKISVQSASSLFSLKAIQNDVREIDVREVETDLTEVCCG